MIRGLRRIRSEPSFRISRLLARPPGRESKGSGNGKRRAAGPRAARDRDERGNRRGEDANLGMPHSDLVRQWIWRGRGARTAWRSGWTARSTWRESATTSTRSRAGTTRNSAVDEVRAADAPARASRFFAAILGLETATTDALRFKHRHATGAISWAPEDFKGAVFSPIIFSYCNHSRMASQPMKAVERAFAPCQTFCLPGSNSCIEE